MALTILYTVTRSSDFKSITITDNGTAWGVGGEMGTGDVTAISLGIYGTDKEVELKVVDFGAQEIIDFLAGSPVTLLFSDSRLWSTTFAPDNFYTCELIPVATGYSSVSQLVPFDSYFYMKKIIMTSISAAAIPQTSFYEANRKITGDIVSISQLDWVSSILSVSREVEWRKVYNFISWNYPI